MAAFASSKHLPCLSLQVLGASAAGGVVTQEDLRPLPLLGLYVTSAKCFSLPGLFPHLQNKRYPSQVPSSQATRSPCGDGPLALNSLMLLLLRLLIAPGDCLPNETREHPEGGGRPSGSVSRL